MQQIPLMGFDLKPQPPAPAPPPRGPQKKRKKGKRKGNGARQRQQQYQQQQQRQRQQAAQPRNEARRSNAKRHKVKRKRNYTLHYILLTTALVITFIVLSYTVLFNVNTIEVTGETALDPAVIAEQSGVKVGDNLLLINRENVQKAILDQTYLLDAVNVKRRFPSKLEIELVASDAKFGIKYGGMHYYFSGMNRLIAITEDNTKPDVVVFRGIEMNKMELGDYIKATPENNLDMCMEILTAIVDSSLTDISYVDMRDIVNVSIFYKNEIQIKVGNITELPYKLESSYRVISQKITQGEIGVLDVQSERKAYFRQIEITMP